MPFLIFVLWLPVLLPPVVAQPAAVSPLRVVSVSAARTRIAAGAVRTEAHQTEVAVRLSRPVAGPVAVWLEGGEGCGRGTETMLGIGLCLDGSASLACGDTEFRAGDMAAMVVVTNAQGLATVRLTSSNLINGTCVVHAKAGTDTSLRRSEAKSRQIRFELGVQEVQFPSFLVRGSVTRASVTRQHGGQALPGHDTVLYVAAVTVKGKTFRFDWRDPLRLTQFASIPLEEVRQLTDASGTVTASVTIGKAEGLENVLVMSRDLQVFVRDDARDLLATPLARLADERFPDGLTGAVGTGDPIAEVCMRLLREMDGDDPPARASALADTPAARASLTEALSAQDLLAGKDWSSQIVDFKARKRTPVAALAEFVWRRAGMLPDPLEAGLAHFAIRDFRCRFRLVRPADVWLVSELGVSPTRLRLDKDVAARVDRMYRELAGDGVSSDAAALLYCGIAYQYLLAGNPALAEAATREAVLERDSFTARFLLGVALRLQRRYRAAESEFMVAAEAAVANDALFLDAERQVVECQRLGQLSAGPGSAPTSDPLP